MLYAEPTKHGGGVTLWGDAWDMRQAHDVIHTLAGDQCPLWRGEESDFVLNLAYEIRKAFEGQRRRKDLNHFDDKKVIYGVDVLWPSALLPLALLRRAAGFMPTDAYVQATLYALEACIHRALRLFLPADADEVLQLTIAAADGPINTLLKVNPSRIHYFAAQSTAEKRKAALLPVLHSYHYGDYDLLYRMHEGMGNPKKLVEPAVYDAIDPSEDLPRFRW